MQSPVTSAIPEWKYYKTAAGASPVEEFLKSPRVSPKDFVIIEAKLMKVQLLGLREARKLRGEIFEVKAGNFRILFTLDESEELVTLALNAFRKKGQKCPESEIVLAERRLRDWRRQHI